MKKIALSFALVLLASLAWMGFIREPLPPVPEICAELSPEVKLGFSINKMDHTGLEFALNEKPGGKGMYVQFKMDNAWKSGRPGLVVQGIRENSGFSNGMSPREYLDDPGRKGKGGKDFSDFMKDNNGRQVSTYTFSQKLVEGTDGKTYLQMAYDGPAMDMLQTLDISRPITIPKPVSQKFTSDGVIQFQPGKVAFDRSIRGFNIPVVIR